jgi:glycosyltransferase involved in cell wall biosynthesis
MADLSLSKRCPTLFLSSGFLGPRSEGNQSLRNTVVGFLNAGYRVYHFSFVSEKDPAFDFTGFKGIGEYRHFGLPRFILAVLRVINGSLGLGQKRVGQWRGQCVDIGLTEVTWRQNLAIVLGTVFEFFRMAVVAVMARPVLFYGYDVSGVFAAMAVSRLGGKKCVTKFQGTYITEKNWKKPVMCLHVAAFRLRSKGVVVTNDGTRGDRIAGLMGIGRERLFFRPNGIDERLVQVKGKGERGGAAGPGANACRVAGLFTRFYPYKRVDRSLGFIARMNGQGAWLHLMVAGSGPLEGELRAIAEREGLSGRVTWLGSVPYAAMAGHYNECDLILHLNDYANINNQLLEAIYLGVPVIALDDGYNSALFGDCPFVLFVKPERLDEVMWSDVERLMGRRGAAYSSPHIKPWSERMKEEIEWIEKI